MNDLPCRADSVICRGLVIVVLLFCLLCAADVVAGNNAWFEVQSPHFRVLSDASERSARDVASEFEQIRSVFIKMMPDLHPESGIPFLIVAPVDEQSAKALLPRMWKDQSAKPAGVYFKGWEQNVALVRMDVVRMQEQSQTASSGYQTIYHEYTHSLLHANFQWLPVWFDEGFAEFCAFTRFEHNKTYVGAPSIRLPYATSIRIPLEKLINVTQTSSEYRDEDKVQFFYGEAWALVHFLMMSDEMGRGKRLQSFLTLLAKGVDQKEAFREAIGDFNEVEKRLFSYTHAPSMRTFVMDRVSGEQEAYRVRRLSQQEADIEIGDFQVGRGEKNAARGRLEKALSDSPGSAAAHQAMAFLHFTDGDDTEAAKEFDRALQLDGNLYLSAYYKNVLSSFSSSGKIADRETLRTGLNQVVRINPQFAPAYVQLARLAIQDHCCPVRCRTDSVV